MLSMGGLMLVLYWFNHKTEGAKQIYIVTIIYIHFDKSATSARYICHADDGR